MLMNLSGPSNVTIGQNVTLKAMKGGLPCANCELLVKNPDDSTFIVRTDDFGLHTFIAQDSGMLTFVLTNGSSLDVDVWSQKNPAVEGEGLVDKILSCALPLWIILIIAGLVIFFYLKRGKKGPADKSGFNWKGKQK
jgi:hypothetical protein